MWGFTVMQLKLEATPPCRRVLFLRGGRPGHWPEKAQEVWPKGTFCCLVVRHSLKWQWFILLWGECACSALSQHAVWGMRIFKYLSELLYGKEQFLVHTFISDFSNPSGVLSLPLRYLLILVIGHLLIWDSVSSEFLFSGFVLPSSFLAPVFQDLTWYQWLCCLNLLPLSFLLWMTSAG